VAAADPTAQPLISACRPREPGSPAGTKAPRRPAAQWQLLLLPLTTCPGRRRGVGKLHPCTPTAHTPRGGVGRGKEAGGGPGASETESQNHRITESQNHRITEWLGLEGTSVGHLVQPPAEAGSPTVGCRGPCPGRC